MSRKYTDLAKVSENLNGLELTSSTTPTSTTVDSWIEEASAQIEGRTRKIFGTESFDYYMDYKGGDELRIQYTPIVTMTSLSYDSAGLGETASWTSLTEGRADDYITYSTEGVIKLINHSIPCGFKNVHLEGTYGYTETPLQVQELATILVSKKVINSVLAGQSSSEGGEITVDVITIKDPTTFSLENVKAMNEEIDRLYKNIGVFNSTRLKR